MAQIDEAMSESSSDGSYSEHASSKKKGNNNINNVLLLDEHVNKHKTVPTNSPSNTE